MIEWDRQLIEKRCGPYYITECFGDEWYVSRFYESANGTIEIQVVVTRGIGDLDYSPAYGHKTHTSIEQYMDDLEAWDDDNIVYSQTNLPPRHLKKLRELDVMRNL